MAPDDQTDSPEETEAEEQESTTEETSDSESEEVADETTDESEQESADENSEQEEEEEEEEEEQTDEEQTEEEEEDEENEQEEEQEEQEEQEEPAADEGDDDSESDAPGSLAKPEPPIASFAESTPTQSLESSQLSESLTSAFNSADQTLGQEGTSECVSHCPEPLDVKPVTPVPKKTGHIFVTVKTPDGDPVPNASLTLDGAPAGATDKDGNADLGDVPIGQHTVDAARVSFDPIKSTETKNVPAGTATYNLVLKPNYVLTCRWLDESAYCGDNVRLVANVNPTPPDGPIKIEILHPGTGAVLETLTGKTITAGRIETFWGLKAQTASWRTDEIPFRATVASVGVTGTSENKVKFKARPTTAWIFINKDRGPCTSIRFGKAEEVVDARLEAGDINYSVHYSLKLRVKGDPFSAAKQADAKSRIEGIWNAGFSAKKFHRKWCGRGRSCNCAFDCCKAGFRLELNFVTSGEHYLITIKTAPDPSHPEHSDTGSRKGTWSDPPISIVTSYAHEAGHMLGQFDEYAGGGQDKSGVQPAESSDNLMGAAGNTTLFNRHYRWVLDFLNTNAAGDPYEIIPP